MPAAPRSLTRWISFSAACGSRNGTGAAQVRPVRAKRLLKIAEHRLGLDDVPVGVDHPHGAPPRRLALLCFTRCRGPLLVYDSHAAPFPVRPRPDRRGRRNSLTLAAVSCP